MTTALGTESWHGTTGGYTNHLCHCDRCTAEWTAYARDRRNYIRAFGEPLPPGWRELLGRKDA